MDEVDRKILDVLKKNSRVSYKEIAKHVKISDVAVHKRIKKLEAGVIRAFTVSIDQRRYGKEVTAIITAKCEVGKTGDIAKEMMEIGDVTEVYTTVGEYDVVAKVRTVDIAGLRVVVEKGLSGIEGINEIRTSLVFECLKEDVCLVM